MSRKEYNPFPNASVIDRKARGGAAQSGHHVSSAGSASSIAAPSRKVRSKDSSRKKGLSSTTPSSIKRLRGGGRY